ncbi:hypothetical protein OSTOST_19784, partial [Ostertagia ostertagi]
MKLAELARPAQLATRKELTTRTRRRSSMGPAVKWGALLVALLGEKALLELQETRTPVLQSSLHRILTVGTSISCNSNDHGSVDFKRSRTL